jgi:hypothetical protein
MADLLLIADAAASTAASDTLSISGNTVAIFVTCLMTFIGGLLLIIGYFVNDKLRSIQSQNSKFSSDLGTIRETQQNQGSTIVEIKAHAQHQAEAMDEFCDRLKSVASHQNTEKIAVLERENVMLMDEVNKLRPTVHDLQTKVQIILNKMSTAQLLQAAPPG